MTMKMDQQDTKGLHQAVSKLGQAKKQLANLRSTRWQLHTNWLAFLQTAISQWQANMKEFTANDADLLEKITVAKTQLAQAREALANCKEKVAGAEGNNDVKEISDEEMVREETSKELVAGFQQMTTSLEALQKQAEKTISEKERAAKRTKYAASGDAPSAPSAATSPSTVPFCGGVGK